MKSFGLLWLLIIISILPVCFSATISVCSSSCDFTNISDAVLNASNGDTISISSGVYEADNIIVNKSLILKGNGIDDTYIVASLTPSSGSFLLVNLQSGDLTIKDLTINLSGNYNGINVQSNSSSSTIEISNLKINGGLSGPFPSDIGIYVNGTGQAKVKITNSIFDSLNTYGILVEKYLGETEITYCNFSNTKSPIHYRTFDNENIVSSQKINFNTFDMTGAGVVDAAIRIRSGSSSAADRRGRYSNLQIQHNTIFSGSGSSGIELYNDANLNSLDGEISSPKIYYNNLTGTAVSGSGISLNGFVNGAEIKYNSINSFAYGVSVLNLNSLVDFPAGTIINYNNLTGASVKEVQWTGALQLNAKLNWWGSCNPNFMSIPLLLSNTDTDPILGSCINSVNVDPVCALEKSNVSIYANISNSNIFSCVNNVKFSVLINSNWTNFTATQINGNPLGNYRVKLPSLIGNTNILWNLYLDDCFGHADFTNGSFTIKKSTVLTTNPSSPDGLNGWFITSPIFSLFNPDATQIQYRWNTQTPIVYAGSFNLDGAPNDANSTGGIIDLHYWSDACNEAEQTTTIKVDLRNPTLKSTVPANGSTLSCSNSLKISAVIDDFFGTNSGVNKSTIIMKLDSIQVANITIENDSFHNTIASFTPLSLSSTSHTVDISGSDLSGRNFSYSWSFNVNYSNLSASFNVYSPLNATVYPSKSILFSIFASSKVLNIGYIDYSDVLPKAKYFCSNCMNVSKKLTMTQGQHNVGILVSDFCGNTQQKNVSFMIDALIPRVLTTTPAANAYLNSTDNFTVDYSEENLKNITLFYGNNSLTQNCTSGLKQKCTFKPNLTLYDNKSISYWFVVRDAVNSKNSTKRKIFVDVTAPIITVYNISSKINSSKLTLNLTISEAARVQYSLAPGKWNSLCSNCNSFGYTSLKTIALKKGNYTIMLKATDKAFQTDSKTYNVTVN